MTRSPRKSSKPLLADPDATAQSRPRKPRDPKQPRLPLDPMPSRIEPCLALSRSKPPIGPDWLFEIKWDGYRLAVHVESTGVRILTRGGLNWTHRFPAIVAAAAEIGTTAILDGEAVVFDEQGRPDFGLLQQSLGGRGGKLSSGSAIFMAFDLLYFDGHDLRSMELSSRRHLLESIVPAGSSSVLRLSEVFDGDGAALFDAACENGLEGIIAKRTDAPYHSDRRGDWIKVKCVQSASFIIVGYEPSTAALGGIGRLLLAAYKGDELVYVGGVGTGFKERETMKLRKDLDSLKTSRPAVALKRKGVVWVQPTLIAEIEYRAWTHDGMLRHASYKGLRERQDNAEVHRI
ncbi:non-homologous end-joining DNA ligase [Rhizobium sp. BR 317]|uniref:non-homologous end-joining DNA ligase n=1 Tax=Rhizobium sp. BR 317 TaxID=3040015 RepID=UPI0039BF1743